MIVEYAPEKVLDLRMVRARSLILELVSIFQTSSTLKLFVDELAKMPKSEIALVDKLRIDFKMNKIWLMFWISKSGANLYKLRRRLRPIHSKFKITCFVNDVSTPL